MVNLLLKSNANPNPLVDGITPLFIASQEGHHDIVRLLLNANANPNVYTDDGITPLMIASFNCHPCIVQLLLKSGADPNISDSNEVTALMSACYVGSSHSAEFLLKHGANPRLETSDGFTALNMAASSGLEYIVDLIQALELSQSSSTTPVLTATGSTDNVDKSILNQGNDKKIHANRKRMQVLFKKHAYKKLIN